MNYSLTSPFIGLTARLEAEGEGSSSCAVSTDRGGGGFKYYIEDKLVTQLKLYLTAKNKF